MAVSLIVMLLLPSAAYGASNIVAGSEITVEKGKVCDREGNLYTGWYIKNRQRYYAENGKRTRGWKKIGKQYYYFESNYALARNKYPYRLRCDKTYALEINDGKVSWK